mmetsp:Transcript_15965/g.24859  ORF Transcript_15965/g.24859 Transcript_15965/m.24859 type:complete len:764 (-) Transcript_15965:191-2482(-)|eukprot:CAMPEP_0195293424 /NCGR_PEP_ID=MMETSP0707-20130614/12403_1 /TAXON_ID=33640 /ORGANISM="Asterionellopsis glacialis, Strain CCMP134" /LENGTH=763 /DNA_ID=CAMNT_0040354135 /DNA_START=180 /DNA_END=2471 /DNA_ORIENTATION=+
MTKIYGAATLALALGAIGKAASECSPAETSFDVSDGASKLKLVGFDSPVVDHFSSAPGMGNKIILKGYTVHPQVAFVDGEMVVSAGESCDATATPSASPTEAESGSMALLGAGSYILGGPAVVTAASLFMAMTPFALASVSELFKAGEHDCGSTLTVEIYTDVDELIHKEAMQGACPAESLWWAHHEGVFGGYEGCVGEKYLFPCAQDAQGISNPMLYEKMPINWEGEECVETGYTTENRAYWILWGDPLDKEELLDRTGLFPTVKFPLRRGPYPSYTTGTGETESYDDSSSAKAVAKDFLIYLGAMPESERDDWYVSFNEGAEQGISTLWAAKALEIAKSTCNRDIYVLMEAPAYGYNNGAIASWVNRYSSDFYEGEECLCYPNCKEKTVTVNNVGFFPPDIPERLGGDNVTYAANSASLSSPWFESMVFPENPSGVIKTPQLPNKNRRVCDGVYVWPMYFGMRDFKIPLDERPECSAWAYAITKGYSASVRAGFITYSKDSDEFVDAVGDILSPFHSLSYGTLSQWTWEGQMQLQQMIMSKELSDPTSWVGAYSSIMKEKWEMVTEAFEDCPVVELTNSMAGAYAFFMYKEPYLGLQDSFISSFFMDVLGVQSTTYNWGFRGADPSTYYGEGYGTYDFTRMQLYRDINVYEEVSRRAAIVCNDTSASVGDFMSIDEWAEAAGAARRLHKEGRMLKEGDDKEVRRLMMKEELPHLHERKLGRLLMNMEVRDGIDNRVSSCAPDYTSSCLFEKVGRRFEDDKF